MKNEGDKTMKKVLLTSVVALAAFGAVQAVSADTNNGQTVSGVVNQKTGKIDQADYQGNKVVSQHTGVVPDAEQYKPATPAYNPYHGKPVVFANGQFVRFAVKDIQGNPIAGVKVDILAWANDADYQAYKTPKVVSAVSNEAGDVELPAIPGELFVYRVSEAPKGYWVPAALQKGTADGAAYVHQNGKDMFTNSRIDLVLEKTDSYNVVKDQCVQEEDGWKYYASNKAVSGWKQVDGKWYFFNAEGVMQKWWVKDGNTWYYLNGNGEMQTGWLQDGGKWYYLENSGAMKASQWFTVGGKWYYVDGSGALAVNTTVGGYMVNGNGEWVK